MSKLHDTLEKYYSVRNSDPEFKEPALAYMEEEIDNLRYDLSGLKKIIVPAYGLKIPVSIGSFIVSGDKKILNHILKTGVGSKRNSGFGLVEQVM